MRQAWYRRQAELLRGQEITGLRMSFAQHDLLAQQLARPYEEVCARASRAVNSLVKLGLIFNFLAIFPSERGLHLHAGVWTTICKKALHSVRLREALFYDRERKHVLCIFEPSARVLGSQPSLGLGGVSRLLPLRGAKRRNRNNIAGPSESRHSTTEASCDGETHLWPQPVMRAGAFLCERLAS